MDWIFLSCLLFPLSLIIPLTTATEKALGFFLFIMTFSTIEFVHFSLAQPQTHASFARHLRIVVAATPLTAHPNTSETIDLLSEIDITVYKHTTTVPFVRRRSSVHHVLQSYKAVSAPSIKLLSIMSIQNYNPDTPQF